MGNLDWKLLAPIWIAHYFRFLHIEKGKLDILEKAWAEENRAYRMG